MPTNSSMRILAGDIGGTNTRLCVYTRDAGGQLVRDAEPTKFKNKDFDSLDAILARFLAGFDAGAITDACFGIAGPVDGRQVRLTNIAHWPLVTTDDVAGRLKIAEPHRVNLINDMPAHAASLSTIVAQQASDVSTLRAGSPRQQGTQVICMPGTGLGIGMLVWDAAGKLHRPISTEGGHADLVSRDAQTDAIIVSMRRLLGTRENVSREHLVSGPGLRAIYACLKNPASPDIAAAPPAEQFLSLEATDPIARETLDCFTRLLGELCGNLAFELLATGGIFIAGSIATSLKARLASPLFTEPFLHTGPPALKELIESVPVTLITYQDTGLLGAATYATWAAQKRVSSSS